jgi:membrane protein DedA with SNARE-associated domain
MLSLAHIVQLLLLHRYALLFPISVVEGPIVSILGGFLASTGHLNIYLAYLTVVLGDLVGDTLYYSLGKFGGINIIKKYGRFLRMDSNSVAGLESHFQKHAGKTLVIGKFSHGLGSIVLFAAGLGKVPYRRFFWYNLFSTMLKSFILITIGYYFGYAYQKIDVYFDKAAYVIPMGIVIIGLVYYYFTKKAAKSLLKG